MKQVQKKHKNEFELPIFQIFSLIFIIGVIIFFSALFFDYINQQRSLKVFSTYEKETNDYMKKNYAALQEIFVSLQNADCSNSQYNYCSSVKQEDIMNALSDDLTNFSSTVFVAPHKKGGLVMMRLSGEREKLYMDDPRNQALQDLVTGKEKKLQWDEYTYLLNGKEIVIPFKDQNGQIEGLLLRAVIEK